MASPFSLFRRHQQVLMVVLIGLSMFAFIIMDQLRPEHFPAVLGFLGGAGLFWALGAQRGRGIPYAIAGGVLGLILGFYAPRLTSRAEVIESNYGALTQRELFELQRDRQAVNEFVSRVVAGAVGPQFASGQMFGPASEESVVQTWLLHQQAEEMGISLSKDGVFEFLKDLTNNKLTTDVYNEARRESKLGQDELIRLIGYELEANMAAQLGQPYEIRPGRPAQQFMGQTIPAMAPVPLDHATPAQYWELYKRMAVEQQIAVAEIPIAAFIDEKAQPTAAEMAELFEQYKDVYPNNRGPGEPGFLQPVRAQIAFLQARYDQAEQDVTPPTEDELRAYYEANKGTMFLKPSGNPFEMELQQGTDDGPVEAPTPPGAENEEAAPPAAPAAGDTETPANPEAAPATPESTPAESSESNDSCAPPEDESADAENDSSDAEPPSTEAPAETTSDTPAETPDAPATPAETPKAPATPAETPAASTPDAAPEPPAAKQPEYESFESVKEQIERSLRQQKIREQVQRKIDAAAQMMSQLGREYRGSDPALGGTSLTPQGISDRLKSYATEHGLRYVVTPMWTQQEFIEQNQYDIKDAYDLNVNRPLGERLYADERDLYYAPTKATSFLTQDQFAVWKIGFKEAHVPESYEEVKDQIVEAWRIRQAYPKAQKRAEELAKSVGKEQSLSAALEGKTTTGAEGSDPLVVKQSEPFSWVKRRQQLDPRSFDRGMQLEPTDIAVVDQEGMEFMELVCNQLKVGETGSAPNYPRTKIYVAQVKSRQYGSEEELAALRKRFLNEEPPFDPFMASAYRTLVLGEQDQVNRVWGSRLFNPTDAIPPAP